MGLPVEGATVLVTGASAGIGAALAPMLAARGATVGLIGRRADRLAEVLDQCRVHQPASRMWVTDLADVDGAAVLTLEIWDALGHLDVVVHNAAIPKRRDVRDLTPEELDETMAVNFLAPARMTMALLPRMLDRGWGVIVNVGSLGGRLGIPHETAYCASKFALSGWTESMAMDLWDTGIDVRLVIPGPIDTEIWDRPANETALYDGPKEPPSVVAEAIVAAIEGDTFEHYVPDLRSIVEFKTSDIGTFLEGAAAMARDAQQP